MTKQRITISRRPLTIKPRPTKTLVPGRYVLNTIAHKVDNATPTGKKTSTLSHFSGITIA